MSTIINKGKDCYSESAKTANVRPIFKKDERTKVKNDRPVSLIFNTFSKIYGRFIHGDLIPFVNYFLREFISTCRKTYSINHVLIRLIENWKKTLDQNKFIGVVLMDLSKCWLHSSWLANSKNACTWIFKREFDFLLFIPKKV